MTTSSITSRRSLHLVDLENLVGDPFAPCARTLAAFDGYLALAGWEPGDHVIVASNRWLISKVAFDLPVPCNTHAVRGRDGADLMLLSLAPSELVARPESCSRRLHQFDHVFLLPDPTDPHALAA